VRFVDLSTPIDASYWEPDPIEHRRMSPAEGAEHMSRELRARLGLEFDPAVLPDGEFLNNDFLTLSAHTGTHVDAPAHYGTRTTYGEPRTVDQLPLDWFVRPGVRLDLRDTPAGPVGAVDADQLAKAIARTGYRPQPLDIVLLHTGADERAGSPEYFTTFVGLTGDAVEMLLDLGVRVIGTDAFSLDAPFPHIVATYVATDDPAVLWPAHFAGRRREYCQIERLANLGAQPVDHGFTVSCLPVKITGAGAGWTRAVAWLEE
jgi:cyclase